ncbi:MFS transporter [Candidatus Microgenomates bacterium]|nr:MAG: MFS transporter [Candidatus Microgenomates bacterium]
MDVKINTLFLLHILNDGIRTTVISLLPFIVADLSLTLAHAGILGSSQALIGTLLAIPSGYIAYKFGGFRVLVFCLLLYSLGLLGISAAPVFPWLLLAFFATASGFGFFHPVSFALVSRLSQKNARGKTMGNFLVLGDIGRIVIPAAALSLATVIGWRYVYVLGAVVGLMAFIASKLFVKNPEQEKHIEQKQTMGKRQWLQDIGKLLRQSRFRIVLFSAIGDSIASSSNYVYLTFLLLSRGITASQLAFFITAYTLGSLSGKAALGRLVDRYGNRKVFVLSEWGMGIVLVLLIYAQQFTFLLVVSYLLGIFTRGTGTVIQTLVSEVMQDAHLEKAFGISETCIQISASISIFIMGLIADHFGLVMVYKLAAILAFIATIPLLYAKFGYKSAKLAPSTYEA